MGRVCVCGGGTLDAQGLGKEKKEPRKLRMASQHYGSLVRAESLSFVLEGIRFSHLSQLKSKNKCINIASLFNLT